MEQRPYVTSFATLAFTEEQAITAARRIRCEGIAELLEQRIGSGPSHGYEQIVLYLRRFGLERAISQAEKRRKLSKTKENKAFWRGLLRNLKGQD